MNLRLTSRRDRAIVALAVLGAVVGLSPAAEATNGYLIHGIGTKAKGMAGAGIAFPQDALAAGTNPAGAVFVGKRNDLGVALFNPNRSYSVSGNPSGPPAFGLIPGTVDSDSEYFVVPNFGLNRELNANSTLGLAVYGQGGMNTDYPTNSFFGTSPTGVNLSQLFIVPTWAVKDGSGKHAFGVSAIVAYQQFEVEGVQAFGMFSQNPAALSNNGADDSIGYGARVGYLGRVSDQFSIGVTYQSEVSMEEFDDYAGLFAESGGFDIPANAGVGFAASLSDKITAALDLQQIYYGEIESVGNPLFPNLFMAPLGAPEGAGFGWDDMTVWKLGFRFETDGDWTWRAGFSTGDQPIAPSEVLFNILAPGVVEEHITFGFTRDLGNGRELNFALMHAPSVSVSGPNPLDPAQTIELEMDQFDLEIGFSWGM